MCFPSRGNKKCKGIPPIDHNTPDSVKCFLDAVAAFAANAHATAGNTANCATRNLGFYQAKRNKNDLVIYGPNGKLNYQITGSW
jgi:hypothetical protein